MRTILKRFVLEQTANEGGCVYHKGGDEGYTVPMLLSAQYRAKDIGTLTGKIGTVLYALFAVHLGQPDYDHDRELVMRSPCQPSAHGLPAGPAGWLAMGHCPAVETLMWGYFLTGQFTAITVEDATGPCSENRDSR